MEQYGVVLSPQEAQRMQSMDEATMINNLVGRMPQQTKEQFEHFFLQLQLIVSTATRVRNALEEGNPKEIETALNDADETGITPYILKMTLVQAGSEVTRLKELSDKWMNETEQRMSGLIIGQEDAMVAQKQLAAAQQQLGQFQGNHKEKGKKMLMGVAGKNDRMLTEVTFEHWRDLIQQQKKEAEIRKEYEDRIVEANKKLFEYKQAQKGNAKGVLMKQAAKGDGAIVEEVYFLLKKEMEDKKLEAEAEKKLAEIEAKMAAQAAKNKENTKSVLMRNLAASDNMLCDTCIEAWKTWLVEYKKNKEQEDAVKAAEQRMEAFMKNKSSGAKGVLDRMNSATDSGLVEHVISSWCTMYKEDKKAAEMEEMIANANAKFASFNQRNKQGAQTAGGRAAEVRDYGLINPSFVLWVEAARVERLLRYYNNRMDAKKYQLHSLQTMFKQFATQLESGLKDGTPRAEPKKLSKSDQTVSLPDIHKKDSGSNRSGRKSQKEVA